MAKSKYETHVLPNLDKITQWARSGVTVKDIAANLHIAYSTFRKYLDLGQEGDERYTALSAPFARACEVSDDEVEAALYKSCLGYNAKVAKTFKVKEIIYDPDTGKKVRETETLQTAYDEVHVAANTTAQMFWLTNRRAGRWKHKPQSEGESQGSERGVIFMPGVADG